MHNIPEIPRTRRDDFTSSPTTIRTLQQRPGQQPTEIAAFTGSSAGGFKEIVDVNHPGYESRIKRGEYIASPMAIDSYHFKYSDDAAYLATHPDGTRVWNTGSGPLLLAIGHGPELPSKYTSRADVAKLQALASVDKTPMDVAEDIGELLAGAASVAKSMAGILSASQAYKATALAAARARRPPKFSTYTKGKQQAIDTANAKAWIRAPANHWAAYRFGFLPFMDSLNSALMALSGFDAAIPVMRTSTGSAETSENFSYENVDTGQWIRSKSRQINASWRAYIHYRCTNPCSALDLYNIRMKAIPATLWAIVPYSFMIDRVVDVSSSLKALSNLADSSIEIIGAGVTEKVRIFDYESATAKSPWNGWTQSSFCDSDAMRKRLTRTLWRPTIWDAIPVSNAGRLTDTVAHCADLAALIAQQII